MTFTKHAKSRSQQRGIPPFVVDLLLRFGKRDRLSEGTEVLYFDRTARKQIDAYVGGLMGKLNEHLNAYAVVANESVVTVGPRYKRIKHI